MSGRTESGLLAASRYVDSEDPDRRALLTLPYGAERSGKGLAMDRTLEEQGEAPLDRFPRVMEGVVHRTESDLGEPRELIVEGSLAASVSLRCSRCAESFAFRVEIPDFQCAREVSQDAESVDLTDEIRESIILSFPNYPVCNADCRGLCPACGRNLNQGECECKPPEDARWGVLDGLAGGEEQDGRTQEETVKE